ncbi:MAG: PAS domain-containing protein, partial [Halobacteria archaeon]|nr:PAS domain-containing protein [Halobacteria archaeon]
MDYDNEDDNKDKKKNDEVEKDGEPFRLVAENIDDVFWVRTPNNEQVEYVSPAYEEVWGRNRDELYDDSSAFLDCVHPEDRDKIENEVESLENGGFDEVYRIVKPDGETRWIRDRSFTVESGDGETEHIVGVATDITEQKEYEKRLKQQKERFEEFASIVSHDLRNPLDAAKGYLEEARARDEPELLDICERNLDRMENLIENLLTLAREGDAVDEDEMRSVSLGSMAKTAWSNVDTEDAELEIEGDAQFKADE